MTLHCIVQNDSAHDLVLLPLNDLHLIEREASMREGGGGEAPSIHSLSSIHLLDEEAISRLFHLFLILRLLNGNESDRGHHQCCILGPPDTTPNQCSNTHPQKHWILDMYMQFIVAIGKSHATQG